MTYPNDMDFDMLLEQVRVLEGQVQDLIAEVARLRSQDVTGRLADLDHRMLAVEASPVAPAGIDARLRALEEQDRRRSSVHVESLTSMLD